MVDTRLFRSIQSLFRSTLSHTRPKSLKVESPPILKLRGQLGQDVVQVGNSKLTGEIESISPRSVDSLVAKSTQAKTQYLPEIIDNSVELLPGFSRKSPLNAESIDPESLVLVHLTDYPPQNGKIFSAREAMCQDGVAVSRNSVHFTLNHPVGQHARGNWDNSGYAILAPYDKTVAVNEKGLFIEGLPADLYTKGSVKIPQGSVIIKHNPQVEKGKYKISDYEGLPECKLIETSENVHLTTSNVLQQMGYKLSPTRTNLDLFAQGIRDKEDIAAIEKNYKAWLDFCKAQGIKPMIHGYSPNGRAEHLIEALDQLATNNRWTVNGNDYKNILLETISDIEMYSKQGYFVSYDLTKMRDIVKKSWTPRAALKRVENELGLSPILKRPRTSLFYPNSHHCNLDLQYGNQEIIDSNMKFFMSEPTRTVIAQKIIY